MKFFIASIADYSAKCNKVSFKIVETGTLLDGCFVDGFVPKSVELFEQVEMDVPFYVVNGIFGFNRMNNIKRLEQQLLAFAPAGKKRAYKAQAGMLFDEIAKLNVEQPVEEKGEFLGKLHEQLTEKIVKIELLATNHWVDIHRWRHTGTGWAHLSGIKHLWQFTTATGNKIMFSSSGVKTNAYIAELDRNTEYTLSGRVIEHSVYHANKQTWIKNIKLIPCE